MVSRNNFEEWCESHGGEFSDESYGTEAYEGTPEINPVGMDTLYQCYFEDTQVTYSSGYAHDEPGAGGEPRLRVDSFRDDVVGVTADNPRFELGDTMSVHGHTQRTTGFGQEEVSYRFEDGEVSMADD